MRLEKNHEKISLKTIHGDLKKQVVKSSQGNGGGASK